MSFGDRDDYAEDTVPSSIPPRPPRRRWWHRDVTTLEIAWFVLIVWTVYGACLFVLDGRIRKVDAEVKAMASSREALVAELNAAIEGYAARTGQYVRDRCTAGTPVAAGAP